MVQIWDGEKLILKSWIFLVDHFKRTAYEIKIKYNKSSVFKTAKT